MKISFVILSIGDKEDKLKLCINSIHRNFLNKDDYEIVLVGNNIDFVQDDSVTKIIDEEFVEFLGKRKNIGTENSQGDILVHCDDDIIFPKNWFLNFSEYRKENDSWLITSNKVLLPDGSRYWDRATYFPYHQMVDYDYFSDDVMFYQSGAFSVCKRELFDLTTWSNEIPFYGMFKGHKYNEDVEFSIRLKELGVDIHFDKNNTVWHNDFTYASDNITCNKRQSPSLVEKACLNFIIDKNL